MKIKVQQLEEKIPVAGETSEAMREAILAKQIELSDKDCPPALLKVLDLIGVSMLAAIQIGKMEGVFTVMGDAAISASTEEVIDQINNQYNRKFAELITAIWELTGFAPIPFSAQFDLDRDPNDPIGSMYCTKTDEYDTSELDLMEEDEEEEDDTEDGLGVVIPPEHKPSTIEPELPKYRDPRINQSPHLN